MHLYQQLLRSDLILLLQQWQPVDGGQARPDVGERLAQWLSAVDAVRLNGALHAIEACPDHVPQPGEGVDRCAMQDLGRRLREELLALAAARPTPARVPRGRGGRSLMDAVDPGAEVEFATHAQRYFALQKQMEARIAVVRVQLRHWLARGSPALRQLAALDGVLEQMLGAREQRLWALLPACLEGRLRHWRERHAQQLQASGQADAPQRWREPGGWLQSFEQDFRRLWQAEVELRLQPITGLLEAASNENR